jgi:cellulose synthase/poly-beta-1,6-N-acetylglucosamine synthase-like glycosyltransferase
MKQKKISIVVPFREMNVYVQECLTYCLALSYDDFDIILLPDTPMPSPHRKVRVIPTGPVFPAMKRNMAIQQTDAEYCAFIDSDAYPCRPDWLTQAAAILKDPTVGCVGGPNHAPPDASVRERIGTEILFCRLGRGAIPSKSIPGHRHYSIKELPSSNLIGKTELLRKIEGFPTNVLTGEDAFMCFKVTDAGYKIIYSDDVAVYHHRRPFLIPCLRSFFVYGRDKGILFRTAFTPDKLFYCIPTASTAFLTFGWLLIYIWPLFRFIYFTITCLYIALVFLQSMFFSSLPVKLYGLIGIPLSHGVYGAGFVKGVFFGGSSRQGKK